MFPTPHQVDYVLQSSENPAVAFRGLYCLYKSSNSKYSISYICKRLGIKSKGYLSYMMQGERNIPERHWEKLYGAFKLSNDQVQIFEAMLLNQQQGRVQRVSGL